MNDTTAQTPAAETTPPAAETPPAANPNTSTPPAEATPPVDSETPPAETPPTDVETPPPLTWDGITAPEGLEVSEEQQGQLLEILNNRELSPADQMGKFMELHKSVLEAQAAEVLASEEALRQSWLDEVNNDPDIGGDKTDAVISKIGAQFADYDGKEAFMEAMNLTGAGNHPAIIKGLHFLVSKLSEASPLLDSASNSTQEKSTADVLFGQPQSQ